MLEKVKPNRDVANYILNYICHNYWQYPESSTKQEKLSILAQATDKDLRKALDKFIKESL